LFAVCEIIVHMMKDIQIAREANTSPAHISMLRRGKRRASLRRAKKLEEVSGEHFLYWMDSQSYDRDGNPIPQPEPTHADS